MKIFEITQLNEAVGTGYYIDFKEFSKERPWEGFGLAAGWGTYVFLDKKSATEIGGEFLLKAGKLNKELKKHPDEMIFGFAKKGDRDGAKQLLTKAKKESPGYKWEVKVGVGGKAVKANYSLIKSQTGLTKSKYMRYAPDVKTKVKNAIDLTVSGNWAARMGTDLVAIVGKRTGELDKMVASAQQSSNSAVKVRFTIADPFNMGAALDLSTQVKKSILSTAGLDRLAKKYSKGVDFYSAVKSKLGSADKANDVIHDLGFDSIVVNDAKLGKFVVILGSNASLDFD